MPEPVFSESVKRLREAFKEERGAVAELHRGGASGREVAQRYSEAIDRCVLELYHEELETEGVALVALGGYGRGELSPFSDVEVSLAHKGVLDAETEKAFARFVRDLWDIGATVSHSCVSAEDVRRLMEEDIATACSFLDARHLAGSEKIYSESVALAVGDYLSRFKVGFVRRVIEEVNRRYEAEGRSELKLEPNLKTGVGGLRDFHTIRWLRKAKNPEDQLGPSELLNPEDIGALKGAYDFLLRVRAELHLLAGRKHDIMVRELQPEIAKGVGFRKLERPAVEEFMRAYYINSGVVRGCLEAVVEEFKRDRNFFPARTFPDRRAVAEGFVAVGSEVFPVSRELVYSSEAGAEKLLGLFLAVQRGRLTMSKFAEGVVRKFVRTHNPPEEIPTRASSLFLELLRGQGNVGSVLRQMHRTGFLGWLLPEFGELTRLVQFDYYHEYTCDEHSLKAVECLDELLRTDGVEREVLLSIPRTEYLVLAVLLHDIGRAKGSEHAVRGATIARNICRRLLLSSEETELITFLVREHLTMNKLAHRRDFSEEKVIEKFAKLVGDLDRLKHLYLLSYVDLKSVARGGWQEWQGELLWQLYSRTAIYLREEAVEFEDTLRSLKENVLCIRPEEISEQEVEEFFRVVPSRYFVEAEPEQVISHISLVKKAEESDVATFYLPRQGYTDLSVCTRDRRFLFADIAGSLTGSGMNVVGARAYTREDGWVIDIFHITDFSGRPVIDPELLATIDRNLRRVLSGEVSAHNLVTNWANRIHPTRKKLSRIPPEVVIDNETSGRYTIVEVLAPDQIGLLFKIADCISSLGMDIHHAKISTDVDRAVDVFYITTEKGEKLKAKEKLEELQREITRVCSTED